MLRRAVVFGAIGAVVGAAAAQVANPPRPLRIGVLSLRPPNPQNPANAALLEGLREHGYVQGRNLILEFPDANGQSERLSAIAAGFVNGNVDIILVIGPAPLEAARAATRTVPIVMVASSADPVRDGVANTLARPGGNVTGLAYAEPDRFKKQLEVLRSVAGPVARVGVLWDFELDVYRRDWEAPLNDAARVLGMRVQEPIRVDAQAHLPDAIALMKRKADAFLVASGGFMLAARRELADLALRARLPAIAAFREFPEAGLLVSFGPNLPDINRRAGSYVERIVKGARPGDLPIELPNKFDLAINVKTAAALGLTVDPSLLLRATNVYR